MDGTWGQLQLSCLTSSLEEEEKEGVFWMNNGMMEKQKGDSYVVHLEESSGGGNSTCHSKNGSLLNYTVVLIKEIKATRKKILLKNNHGRPMFVSHGSHKNKKNTHFSSWKICPFVCVLSPGQYLSCSAKNFNGEFVCWWSWHVSRVGKVAFIRAQR